MGSVIGTWDMNTMTCSCSESENKVPDGDYACACASGYEADETGGCTVKYCGNEPISDCTCAGNTVSPKLTDVSWCMDDTEYAKFQECLLTSGEWNFESHSCDY